MGSNTFIRLSKFYNGTVFVEIIFTRSKERICEMTRLKTISPLSVVLILAIISSLTLAPTVWAQDDTGADVTGGGTTEGNVQFTPGYIQGTVSIDGEPLQNAKIKVYRNPTTYEKVTDADGQYEAMVGTPDQGAGSWDYEISCQTATDDGRGTLYFKKQIVAISYGETKTVNLDIRPGYVAGKVTVPGAITSGYVSAAGSDGNVAQNITISSDGTFSFPVQPDTNVRVWGSVTANGIPHTLANEYVNVTAGSTSAVNWTIASANISGRVTVSGTGISNLRITVSGGLSTATATTDANGNYNAMVFTPEDETRQCTVTCNNAYIDSGKTRLYFKNQTVTLSHGETRTLNFTFSGRINGAIALPGGVEVSGGTIYVRGSDRNYIAYTTNIAADGTFTLPVEPDSNMTISGNVMVAGSNSTLNSQTLNISANQTRSVNWTIASAQVRGNVKVAGSAAQNATITVSGSGFSNVSARTDASGNYSLMIFTPESGSRACTVTCSNVGLGGSDYISFKPISQTFSYGEIKTINFQVTPGYVTGRIATSETVSGYLYAKDTSDNRILARVAIASDGAFSLPVYPNTDMKVWGRVNIGTCTNHSLSEKSVRVGMNETKTLSWTITTAQINGRVSMGNVGVENALISVPASGGLCGVSTRTASDGTYVLSLFMPESGVRECIVSCTGVSVAQPAKTVALRSNKRETVNWAIASGRIVGRVSLGSTGVANALITVAGVGNTRTDSEGNYSMGWFNMSQESGQQYTVSCSNVYAGDGTQVSFASKNTHVSNGETEVVNFSAQTTTYTHIGGNIGRRVGSGTICAKLPDGTRICSAIQADGSYTLPVPPFTDIVIHGMFVSETGLNYTIDSQTMNISDDDPPEINVPSRTTQGSISGSVTLAGLDTLGQSLDRHYLRSSAGSVNLYENGGDYAFSRLSPRTYYFYHGNSYYVESYLNSGDDRFRHPPANFTAQVALAAGDEITNDVASDVALIQGQIILEGTGTIENVVQGNIFAYGVDGTATAEGWSSDKVDPGTGDYDLVVSEGDWDVYDTRLRFGGETESGDILNSTLNIKDYTRAASNEGEISVSAGEVFEEDIVYETGTVIIRFSVPEGATLRNPRLNGHCVAYDDGVEIRADITATGSSAEVVEGRVAFISIPGTCHLSAYADVISGGVVLSNRHFGDLEVRVIANQEREVNSNGPSITVKSPESGYTTCNEEIMVSGTITYEEEITDVRINEASVDFTSSDNPDDPNEVSFVAVVDLEMGESTIEIVAESGEESSASKAITISRYVAGVFTVGDDGIVTIDWLYDGGAYEGELGIFSLTGMDIYDPNSVNFIREAARRALSDSEEGYVVISDAEEGAKFSGSLGESKDWNEGLYQRAKHFDMKPGDTFATILVPNFTLQELYDDPGTDNVQKAPLFSLASANPEHDMYLGQIADINGSGNAFIYEDKDFVNSDKDYNDLIFQVSGVIVCEGKAPTLDALIADGVMDADSDWREFTDLGKVMVDHIEVVPTPVRMSVSVGGPAALFVYDAQGRECGKDGAYIPGSTFETDESGNQVISLPALESGEYRLVLHGAEDGVCQLSVTEYKGLSEIFSETKAVRIGPGQVLRSGMSVDTDLAVADFSDPEIPSDAEGKPLVYDFDGNGTTDDSDIAKVSVRWNAALGDENYDPFYDLDGDGYIGILDIMAVVNSKSVP